jgi:hypothetical protein
MKRAHRARGADRGAPAGNAKPMVVWVSSRARRNDAVPNRWAVYGIGGFFLLVLVFALL